MDSKFAALVEHLAPKLAQFCSREPCHDLVFIFLRRMVGTYTWGDQTNCGADIGIIVEQQRKERRLHCC
jgi:hypothetical protein